MLEFDRIGGIVQPGGVGSDRFGTAVAVSETHIVIGAEYHDTDNANSGAAYVFDKDGTLVHTLNVGDVINGNAGNSVAINDVFVVVGLPGISKVKIFDVSTGTEITTLNGSGGSFGNSLAIHGDYIAIGAEEDTVQGSNAGAAYIYKTDGTLVTKILPSAFGDNYFFGRSVAINSDKVVVGAPLEHGEHAGSGAVYVYDLTGSEIGKLTEVTSGIDNNFGHDVAINNSSIYTSSPGESHGSSTGGAVYVYSMDLVESKKITPSNDNPENRFGTSIDVSDTHLIVGAPYSDTVNSNAGVVIVYDAHGNELEILDIGSPTADKNVGFSVAIDDGVIVYGGIDFVSTNFLKVAPFELISLGVGINTFGNSLDTVMSLAGFKTEMDSCKTLIDGMWKSWTNDAPDAYQGMLTIEPGRGYVSNMLTALDFKIKGKPVDINAIPMVTGYNMLALPDTNTIGDGYLPRMKFSSVKSVDGNWKSWTAGATAEFQGFLETDPANGYVYDISDIYGTVVNTNNISEGVSIAAGDVTLDTANPSSNGVSLIAPGLDHTVYFTSVTYDGSTPTNIMFYNIDGDIGKLDYPSELEGSTFTVVSEDVTYSGIFSNTNTYTTPSGVTFGAGITLTKTTKTVAADTTYSTMELSVDGTTYYVDVAAEYIGDTFQVWQDGDMREGVFAAGPVVITFA